jgi:hypothetical protein
MSLDPAPSTAALLERAEQACAMSERLRAELAENRADALSTLHTLQAGIIAIDWRAANAWRP